MQILIASPLYPPDVAEPAPYAKTLARRLSADHDVTVLVYGRLPETLPGVQCIAVDTEASLPVRMTHFFRQLHAALKHADVFIALNGASVELPVFIASFMVRCPYIFIEGDARARAQSSENVFRGFLTSLVRRGAAAVVNTVPPERPEILPFAPPPTKALAAYEGAWDAHLAALTEYLHHVRR